MSAETRAEFLSIIDSETQRLTNLIEDILDLIPRGIADYETLLTENPIFVERTLGVGVITPAECKAYGVTGANARASGVDWDLRKGFPYSGIEEYDFDVPTGKHGDVYDRYLVRMAEMRQSLEMMPLPSLKTAKQTFS